MKAGFICVLLAISISLSAQDFYQMFEQSLVDCGLKIYSKRFESDTKRLTIETDSIKSLNYSKISVEPFDSLITISDYDRVDSLISLKYKGFEILSNQRTDEKYGTMYSYVIKDTSGNPFCDRYVIKHMNKLPVLMTYSSVFGNSLRNFDSFECMIEKNE